jgi:hypothetical protein
MKKILALLLLLNGMFSMAQSSIIEYNYHDETYTFYKVTKKGDTIKKKQPFSYKDIPVKVVVKDLNTFYYDVTFESESFDETPINSEQNIETLMSGYSTSLSAFNDVVDEVKGNDIYQSLFKDGKFQGIAGITGAFGAADSGYEDELEQLEDDALVLKKMNDELVLSSIKVDELFDYLTLVEFTNLELQKLLYNPNISHAEMIKRADLLAKEVFFGTVELNSVIQSSSEKAKLVNNYLSAYSSFRASSEAVKTSINELNSKVKSEDIKSELMKFNSQIDQRNNSIAANYDNLQIAAEGLSLTEIRGKLMDVYSNYDKIVHADFNYEYSLLTEKDVTQITMKFGYANDLEDTLGNVKTRILKVPTQGGLRINSSAGLSFVSYFGGQSSYLNNGGTVSEVKGDLFTPAISTMFHFYRQSYRPFTVGGSFGISVPTEGEKDFIYMTGLSGIIGKSQRVIINVGAFGGRVERLSDGLKAGDALISEYSEVPVKKVFDFGLYLGLTFNINSFF